MKVTKKIFSVILIFLVIQLIGMFFISGEVYAGDSFFEKVFSKEKDWQEMGGSNSEAIVQNANGVFQAIEDIYYGIRAVAVGLFMVHIAITAISLNTKNNGIDIAESKMTIVYIIILALLFIFDKQIINFLKGFFEQIESTM